MYRMEENLYRAYEALPIPLSITEATENGIETLLLSEGMCALTGLTRRELLDSFSDGSFFERMHPDDAGKILRIGQQFMSRTGPYDVLYRIFHVSDGKYHTMHTLGKWMTLPDGHEVAVMVFVDVTESIDAVSELTGQYELFQHDVFYSDPVTGLPNGNYMHEFAEGAVDRLRARAQRPEDVVMINSDVIALKSYNNHYGFARGDELLSQIAGILTGEFSDCLTIRGNDDHFVILGILPEHGNISARLERVNEKIRKTAFGHTLGLKSGVCAIREGMSIADALDHSKQACKQIGDNLNVCCSFYTYQMDEEYLRQRYIVESFDAALENNWIRVFYQPIMQVGTGKAAVMEALARWADPVRGTISPGEFIPVLETHHLLYRLDLYMAEQVCRHIPIRHGAGLPVLPVSINFSAQDFDHCDILAELEDIYARSDLERYHFNRRDLIIEITEQDVAAATEKFKQQLRELRRHGFTVWVDDFGSGYSSLNVFSQFDFDLIKFDMDLLRHLDEHEGANRYIMKAIADVARQMGIHTLAEGMETPEQLEFLKSIGCELAQGFLFARPAPLEDALLKIRSGREILPCESLDEREENIRRWEDRYGTNHRG